MDNWAEEVQDIIEKRARGRYQEGLISGADAWSGGTLRGASKQWGARYAESRGALLARIREALEEAELAVQVYLGTVLYGEPRRRHTELTIVRPDGVAFALVGGKLRRLDHNHLTIAEGA